MRPTIWLKMFFTAALCTLLCLGGAQAAPAVSVSAEIGYDGMVTYLYAMPLRVTLKNTGSDADLTVAVNVDRSEREYDRYAYPITLAGGAEMSLTLPLTLNYKQAEFSVEVLSGEETVARCAVRAQKIIAPNTLLVGVLSQNPQALSYMNINAANDQLLRGDLWQTVPLTQESFPTDIALLRAFRILAVDGVDVSAFSIAQQEALQQWLREGGIVIVSGGGTAAASYKGFSALTGVLAMTPYQAQGVDQALLRSLSNTQFAPAVSDRALGNTMLCELRGGKNAVAELDGKPLIDRCLVDQGVVYSAGFSLSEKPLAGWSGMTCFWQRMLLSQDQALYQRVMNELNNYYARNNDSYVDTWLLRQLPLKNEDPVLAVILLTAAFVLLSGVGSYFVLKRFDRREWMWVTAPVLSLACAGALYLLGGRMALNKPAAVTYAVVSVNAEGYTDTRVMAGVAASARTPLRVSAADGARVRPGADYSMGDYNDADEQEEMRKRLRYLYTEGETPSLTLPNSEPWTVQPLIVTPGAPVECPVSAAVWWEEDGLHGQIVNRSDLILQSGYAFTSAGFCSVPQLLPGQSHDFAILQNDKSKEGVITDGELVKGSWADSYSIVSAAVQPEDENARSGMSAEETAAYNRRYSLINTCMGRWNNYSFFRYVTFSDDVGRVTLQIDGRDVRRAAQGTVIDVQMEYRVMSDSGLVRLTRGMIPAYNCDVYADGTPVNNGAALEDYAYFPLRNEPVICFALGQIKGLELDQVEITNATFHCESYGTQPRIWLYNAAGGVWEEAQYAALPIAIGGEVLARCADAQGQLFVRLTPSAGGGSNGEVYNPVLTLEGRSK